MLLVSRRNMVENSGSRRKLKVIFGGVLLLKADRVWRLCEADLVMVFHGEYEDGKVFYG